MQQLPGPLPKVRHWIVRSNPRGNSRSGDHDPYFAYEETDPLEAVRWQGSLAGRHLSKALLALVSFLWAFPLFHAPGNPPLCPPTKYSGNHLPRALPTVCTSNFPEKLRQSNAPSSTRWPRGGTPGIASRAWVLTKNRPRGSEGLMPGWPWRALNKNVSDSSKCYTPWSLFWF